MESSERSRLRMRRRAWRRATAVLGTAALVGCEGSVTLDAETMAPADPGIVAVQVDLEGVEFDGSGRRQTLRFDEPLRVNLVDYVNGNLLRLFTDEELEDGRYTRARLLFAAEEDDDYFVRRSDGGEFELAVAEGTPSDVSFRVNRGDSSRENIVLTLDLRQSLSFNDDTNEYTLTPVLRGVRTEDTGRIAGNVTIDCPSGSPLAQGGAVYLFAGEDVTPDDRNNATVEPYLTTAVTIGAGTAVIPAYAFSFVPEGDYTIAVTCNGDEDDAATNDDISFQNASNVEVRAEETLTHDFN